MERITLRQGVHCLHAAVNAGLVETEHGLLAIDTGLDRGAANRILRIAEELGRPIVAIANTHAHADHHGGNAQLVRRLGVPVHAPAVEEAVIRVPRYEPVYLFGGAAPIAALENRFLQAEPSPVDHVLHAGVAQRIDGREIEVVDLAGHSLGQIGLRVDDVLFAADAFFGLAPLAKHGMPYLVDAGAAHAALQRLLAEDVAWMVPGHGEPLDEPADTLRANLETIARTEQWLRERVAREPVGTEILLAELLAALELSVNDPTGFVLYRATLLGYLSSLERDGAIHAVVEAGRWLWSA